MRRVFYSLMLVTVLAACSKSDDTHQEPLPWIATTQEQEWLNDLKAQYASCDCLTGIRMGIYEGQKVYEVYLFDPRCNGINAVYKTDGTVWFTSVEADKYKVYWANVTDIFELWKCSQG
ncbi:MAG: hypothetical protein ABWZ25_15550 [Chitinophagaceae bacterium]